MQRLKNSSVMLVFCLFSLSMAILVTINFKTLFYWQLQTINTEQLIGLSHDVVIKNYDVLLNYLLNPFITTLAMPDIPSSQQGLFHFYEVKQLFLLCEIIFIFTSIGTVIGLRYIFKTKQFLTFFNKCRFACVTPIIIGIVFSLNFDYWFVMFHKLFFNNDAWLFDQTKDPIILVLPENFFMFAFLLASFLFELFFIILFIVFYKRFKTGLKTDVVNA